MNLGKEKIKTQKGLAKFSESSMYIMMHQLAIALENLPYEI